MKENMDFMICPLPEDIARLKHFGDFERMNRMIEVRLQNPKVPSILKERLKYERLLVKDILREYIYTPEEALAKLQEKVKDVTFEEMETFRDQGTLDWVYINGKVFYKDDCVASFIKTRVDMRHRISDHKALAERTESFHALDEIIARMKEKGSIKLRMNMRTTLTIKPEAQCPGETIQVWLPLPVRDTQCEPQQQIKTSPMAAHIASETQAQRTAYFKESYQPGMSFVTEFSYDIIARYIDPNPDMVSPEQPSFETDEMPPQIVFTPIIKELAAKLKGNETNTLKIARAFYDYVTTQTVYRYVPAYRSVANIPEYFAIGQRGDCGMHALLFITLCRCVGIPARWQSGWSARPGHIYSHDWAMFYVAPYGWLYADGSFGGAAYREGHLDRWNFYFGNLEPWRMVSNADFQQVFDPPFPFHRNDPYDNQSGEVCYTDRALLPHEYSTKRECIVWEEI